MLKTQEDLADTGHIKTGSSSIKADMFRKLLVELQPMHLVELLPLTMHRPGETILSAVP